MKRTWLFVLLAFGMAIFAEGSAQKMQEISTGIYTAKIFNPRYQTGGLVSLTVNSVNYASGHLLCLRVLEDDKKLQLSGQTVQDYSLSKDEAGIWTAVFTGVINGPDKQTPWVKTTKTMRFDKNVIMITVEAELLQDINIPAYENAPFFDFITLDSRVLDKATVEFANAKSNEMAMIQNPQKNPIAAPEYYDTLNVSDEKVNFRFKALEGKFRLARYSNSLDVYVRSHQEGTFPVVRQLSKGEKLRVGYSLEIMEK